MGFNRRGRPFIESRLYSFYRSRQLDGTVDLGPRYGTYCLTAARVSARWGAVAEHRWPHSRDHVWPPQEPGGLDRIARFNRTLSYFRVRTLEDLRIALYANGPFSFSLPITAAWRRSNGMIDLPKDTSEFAEQHAITAVGYDDTTQLIHFHNSWGSGWGDKGFGFLPYSYFSGYCSDGWFYFPNRMDHSLPDGPADAQFWWRLSEPFQNALGYLSTVVDVWDFQRDIRIGWCFMTVRDGYLAACRT